MSRHVIWSKNEAQNLDRTQKMRQTPDCLTNSQSRDDSLPLFALINRILNSLSKHLKSNDNLTAPFPPLLLVNGRKINVNKPSLDCFRPTQTSTPHMNNKFEQYKLYL